MQPVLIGGAAGVIGLAIGFLVALSQKNKAVAEYEKRLDEARQKLEAARKEAGEHMEKERSRAVDAERKAKETEEKVAQLQKAAEEQKRSFAELRSQLGQAQASLTETEAARAKAVAQAEANQNARTQAEGRTKQAETHSLQLQKKIEESSAQLQAVQSEVEAQKEAAERRAKEVQKLRAEVTSLKRASSAGLDESMEVFAGTEGSLEGTLKALMEAEGQKAAVLADANGIVVAAVGEKSVMEGMAATSQLVGSLCTQLVDMVPFSSVRAYLLQDTQANVIAGRAFVSGGETIGLATYGQRVPSDRVLDGAMANLKVALE
jgi:myosin heavy subunit